MIEVYNTFGIKIGEIETENGIYPLLYPIYTVEHIGSERNVKVVYAVSNSGIKNKFILKNKKNK